jgi:hypothetical protein
MDILYFSSQRKFYSTETLHQIWIHIGSSIDLSLIILYYYSDEVYCFYKITFREIFLPL